MATVVLSSLVSTETNRELAVTGFVCTNYADLLTVTGGTPGLVTGVLAFVPMSNRITIWQYNAIESYWEICSPFYTTSGAMATFFAGLNASAPLLGGNEVYLTDTGQTGFYNAVNQEWNYVS